MWAIKIFIEICGLPVSLSLVRRLKQAEGLDMYDIGTKFSILALMLNTLTPIIAMLLICERDEY